MNICIIDDDREFSLKFSEKIVSIFPNSVISVVNSHYEDILKKEYEICFFDIVLNDTDGIDLARQYCLLFPNAIIVFISLCEGFVFNAQVTNMFFS